MPAIGVPVSNQMLAAQIEQPSVFFFQQCLIVEYLK
jgi:hypothetical protein